MRKISKKNCAFPKDFPKAAIKRAQKRIYSHSAEREQLRRSQSTFGLLFIVYASAYPAGHTGRIPNGNPHLPHNHH